MTKTERKTHVIDAGSASLGRLAVQIADLLRGKGKATYSPNVDNGDIVIVENIANIKVTGNKMEDKIYYSHSGYTGNLKKRTMKEIYDKNPEEILVKAVNNMLPKNKLRARFITRLKFQ